MTSINTPFGKSLVLMMLMCASITFCRAQSTPSTTAQSDKSTRMLSNKLGIDIDLAKRLSAAYNYKNEEIRALMRDTVTKPFLRQQKLKELLEQRNGQLDAVLTPSLQSKLKKQGLGEAEVLKRINVQQKLALQRMNKVPHTTRQTKSADTVKAATVRPRTTLNNP
jgi:hypothetical protein